MDQTLVEKIVQRVLERLLKPRVGLVCCSHVDLSAVPHNDVFDWVLYPRTPLEPEIDAKVKAMSDCERPIIRVLSGIKLPEEEGATLKMLVVMAPCMSLLNELLTAVPRSLEGALILGCLWRSVPVLIDASRFSKWFRWQNTQAGAELVAQVKKLNSWGITFLGLDVGERAAQPVQPVRPSLDTLAPVNKLNLNTPSPEKTPLHVHTQELRDTADGVTLVLTEPEWLTWSELSRRYNFAKITAVRLEGRARLTPEVVDQLARRRITLIQR